MKKLFRRSPSHWVFMLFLLGTFCTVAMASVFVAYVRDPQDAFNQGYCRSQVLSKLPENAYDNEADDGWGLTWFGGGSQPSILESERRKFHERCSTSNDTLLYDDDGTESTCFIQLKEQAGTDAAQVILGHARKSENQNTLPTPHPCVYDDYVYELDDEEFRLHGMYGKPYSFMHNGSWVISELEQKLGVGFASLDLFHDRPYGGWVHEGRFVDTEFLGMLVMKNLLAQENYYWYGPGGAPSNTPPVGITSREDWAMCRMAEEFDPPTGGGHDLTRSSVNCVFTDGETLWSIRNSDGRSPHFIFYDDRWSTYGARAIVSMTNPTGTWGELSDDNILVLAGGEEGGSVVHGTDDVGNYPNELRIKPEKDLERDAAQPAISVNQADGSFVAAWVTSGGTQTGEEITARWYNQMGMAEDYGFEVHSSNVNIGMKSPAICHSSDGQTIAVVWIEHGPDLILDATYYLKRKLFTWNDEDHSWTPGSTVTVASAMSCGLTPPLAHPSVAFGGDNCVITWEQMECTGEFTEIRVKAYLGDAVVMNEQTITQNANDHEPDIAYVFCDDNLVDYWAIGYHGLVGEQTFAKAASLGRNRGTGIWSIVGTPVSLSQGQHVSVAGQSGTQLYFAYNNGNVRVDRCNDYTGGISFQEFASGEALDANSQPDIALRGDGTFYVCYDKSNAPNGRDIYCARGSGTTLTVEPGTINLFPNNDQTLPAIAIAQDYPINDEFYAAYKSSDYGFFQKRRMVIWQTDGQDGEGVSGVAGQFRGIKANQLHSWYESDNFGIAHSPALCGTIDQSLTISDPVVYMTSSVQIEQGVTLTIQSGVTIKILPGSLMEVKGSLIATNASFIQLEPNFPSPEWSGIYVTGNVNLNSCIIDGALKGVETSKASGISLSNCTITNCGTGFLAYQPSGTVTPQVMGCTFANNVTYGASLLSTVNATFDDCNFTGNGADGMLLTNSYAKIISCDFTDNGEAQGGYGLNCFGSSPMLSCNNFDENKKGEIALYNQSYPSMEPSGGGGKNTLFNSTNNLISMWSSYPLTKNGHNNFTVGGTGYFMADMSAAPKKRDISGNYWNPNLGLSKLYPSSSSVYTWNSIDNIANSCGGTGSGSGAGAAQQMFAEGLAEQSNGNYSAANTLLADVVTQYPDSEWANAALAQMFVTQCMVGDGYPTLQTYMNDIADSSTLAEPAEAFATRLWVEDEQYAPALETYAATMTNPPSEVDSIFAAVDFAVATYRAQGDGGSLDEVNSADVKDVFMQLNMVSSTIPPSPQASHEGFTVIPTEVTLEPNFPNPFNAETTIRYYLPEAQFAEVTIFSIVGQRVATLVSGQMSAGFHDVHWSGSDLASGVYLYQLKVGRSVETKKMVLLK